MDKSARRDRDYLPDTLTKKRALVKEIIQRLKGAWNVTNHHEICAIIKAPLTTVDGWIKNGSVPSHVLHTCRGDTGVSFDELYYGVKPTLNMTPQLHNTLVEQVVDSIGVGYRVKFIEKSIKFDDGAQLLANTVVNDLIVHLQT
jgi:hypothetical protein